MIGTKIAHYEITSHLGSGGMGDVYQATDSKLGRRVAIKFLPAAFASDAERLSRFRREAQVLASLNHSNIAQIYGLEESGESRCIVMEWIDGETLHARIQRGPIPLDEGLAIARQITEALEVAHEKGIVHRDLKPGNVMLTTDGRVKVLDFGLAKAIEVGSSNASLLSSPTMTRMEATVSPGLGTNPGLILGTAAYMSPEQARGKIVDRRTDIWAFGVVLYEMLTGQRAFPGEDLTDTLAAVVKLDPKWEALSTDVPPRVRQVLRICLHKDPRQRPHSIGDVRLALDGAFEAAPEATIVERRSPLTVLSVAGGAIAGAVIAGAVLWLWLGSSPVSVTTRLSVMTPDSRPIVMGGTPRRSLAISPDGSQMVYVGQTLDAATGRRSERLQLRALSALAVRELPGTDGARQPFFSPDGQWVGFFVSTELKKVSVAGGNPVPLVDKINGAANAFGVWSNDNTIIFGSINTGLRRVSAEGGETTTLTSPDAAQKELYHLFPSLLPSNAAVLFSIRYDDPTKSRIDAVMLDTMERRVVLENARNPVVTSSGHILFQRESAILIAPFDARRLVLAGPAIPFLDEVRNDSPDSPIPTAELSVSREGTLAYLPATNTARTLGFVNKEGTLTPVALPPANFSHPRVSPDGQALAFVVAQGQRSEVHVLDLQRGSTTKLTQEGRDEGPVWRDDRSLSFFSRRTGASGIYLKNIDGREQLLLPIPEGATTVRNLSWSKDGTKLAYTLQKGFEHDIWVLTMDEKPTAQAFLNSPASEWTPRFSPDGNWLAYISNESGRSEVYLRKYPEGERLPVSSAGATAAVWSRDGRQVFFTGLDADSRKMMAVSVTPAGDTLRLGKPTPLFELRRRSSTGEIEQYADGGNSGAMYDVLLDGRFVMVRGADSEGTREIVLVQNWFEELRRLFSSK